FGKDKIRVEGLGHGQGGSGFVIMDIASQTATIVMPERHMYMEMPQTPEAKDSLSYFRANDVDKACADLLKLKPNQGARFHNLGRETLNGRSTVKHQGTDSEGKSHTVWLDSKLRFPIKWEGTDEHGGELQNIKEGSQPASLFEIPSGFQKMDMSGLMQRK